MEYEDDIQRTLSLPTDPVERSRVAKVRSAFENSKLEIGLVSREEVQSARALGQEQLSARRLTIPIEQANNNQTNSRSSVRPTPTNPNKNPTGLTFEQKLLMD